MLSLYPDDSTALSNLGLTYYSIEEWEKAAELYRQNIRDGYEGWISHLNLAEIYKAQGKYQEAHQAISERAVEFPDLGGFPGNTRYSISLKATTTGLSKSWIKLLPWTQA